MAYTARRIPSPFAEGNAQGEGCLGQMRRSFQAFLLNVRIKFRWFAVKTKRRSGYILFHRTTLYPLSVL